MKLLQFIILLVQRGSLGQQPVDFDAQRKRIIEKAALPTSDAFQKKTGSLKSLLLSTRAGYSLLANLAYLKNSARMNNMYFISERRKVIYIRILKCASTSMLKEFLPLVDDRLNGVDYSDEQVDALGFYYAHKKIQHAQSAYTKFALVRNPFQRIVSVYLDLFDPAAVAFTYDSYWFGILKRGMSFKDFIKTIIKVPASLLGPHFSPQSYILQKATNINDIKIYRLEKNEEELIKFLDQFGMKLRHLNKQRSEYDYRSYYDNETLALVDQIYRDDVNLFGYQEEHRALQIHLNARQENRIL